ncbi:MAG: glycosyltransferase family 4 protein [Microvirga sp.]|nr:glycosyltransferase family 4 protein [Microvirga sp.]
MRLAVVLPRNMRYGPDGATSIDLCARDAALHSRHRAGMTVLCEESPGLFGDGPVATFRARTTFGRVREIARLARGLAPDLVVAHQHLPTAAGLAARLPDTPTLLYMHGMPRPASGWRRWLKARRHDRLAGLIFVSSAARDAFAALYPDVAAPSFVVPNGLDPAPWRPEPGRADEIVCVGRIEPEKGSLEIARALADALPDHPGWRARFVGPASRDPAYSRAFAEAIAVCPAVTWEGALPFERMREIALGARIAVVASRSEGFGRVAIEAFAAGLALISTRAGGLDEVIGDCALSLARGDRDEIAQALRRLIADAALREDLGARGRARFEANFTIDAFASAFDAAVESVVSGRKIEQ